jgi:hypothetical protein
MLSVLADRTYRHLFLAQIVALASISEADIRAILSQWQLSAQSIQLTVARQRDPDGLWALNTKFGCSREP